MYPAWAKRREGRQMALQTWLVILVVALFVSPFVFRKAHDWVSEKLPPLDDDY